MHVLSSRYVIAVLILVAAACAPDGERTGASDAAGFSATPAGAPAGVRLHLTPPAAPGDVGAVEVTGLDPEVVRRLQERAPTASEWRALFAVHTADAAANAAADRAADGAADATLPPVLGTYAVDPPVVRFTPRFPLVPGLPYRARLDVAALYTALDGPAADRSPLDTTFAVPDRSAGLPTVVTGVYPSADALPMNLLKFYVQFSAPMATGRAYAHLDLIDEATGAPVEAPFVVLNPELWDPARTRLTLLFDPGRLKRGVGPNLEMQTPLEAGGRYTLVVNRAWTDATGRPLADTYRKTFEVVEADRAKVDPDAWHLTPPAAATRDPVVVRFPEPLDHALLQRLLTVRDRTGAPVEGRVEVSHRETQWAFTPVDPWRDGTYEVHVETILEDVAGNNLRSAFDVDLDDAPSSEEREAETVHVLPFVVAPAAAL